MGKMYMCRAIWHSVSCCRDTLCEQYEQTHWLLSGDCCEKLAERVPGQLQPSCKTTGWSIGAANATGMLGLLCTCSMQLRVALLLGCLVSAAVAVQSVRSAPQDTCQVECQ